MKKPDKNGVVLAYEGRGSGSRAIVFIHGLGFDHTTPSPQIEFFSRTHCVIAMDLRGHGASDASKQHQWGRALGTEARIVSVTVDPEHDKPDELLAYANEPSANLAGWLFLTGTPKQIDDVMARFRLVR
jgi:pimeloyl-ACP methyl ester carboxylesterase